MPSAQIIYWDSSVFIDWLEGRIPERVALIEPVLRAAKNGDVLIVTSAWALAEVVRIKGQPLSDVDEQKIIEFFEQAYIQVRPLDMRVAATSRAICRKPTDTGKMLKPKDAVHVATAMHARIGRLHTFDSDSLVPFSDMFRLRDTDPFVKISLPGYTPSVVPEPAGLSEDRQKQIDFPEHEAQGGELSSTDSISAAQGNEMGAAAGSEKGDGGVGPGVQEGIVTAKSGVEEGDVGESLPPDDHDV